MHTKGEWERPCGCKVVKDATIPIIQYCPKHKAAPDLYEALKEAQVFTRGDDRVHFKVSQALAKVDNPKPKRR